MRRNKVRELDQARLPVVDLSLSPTRLKDTLAAACEEFGFFYVENHGVAPDLVEAQFDQSRRFHALRIEDKERLRINVFHRGYIGLSSYRLDRKLAPNLSESLVIMHELEENDHADIHLAEYADG